MSNNEECVHIIRTYLTCCFRDLAMHPIAARVVKQSKLNKVDVSGIVEVAAKSLNQTSWIVDDVVVS